jgi:hypothetical protein
VVENSATWLVDVFVEELELAGLGPEGSVATGQLAYNPVTMLKLRTSGPWFGGRKTWPFRHTRGQ